MDERKKNDDIIIGCNKIKNFLTNITLEPMMFMWGITAFIHHISVKQLVIGMYEQKGPSRESTFYI